MVSNGSEPGAAPGSEPGFAPSSAPGSGRGPELATGSGFEPASAAPPPLATTTASALKIAVVGPVGVGKTTLVTSVSEIRPLTTEEHMAADADRDRSSVPDKATTTVAMDFGRISLSDQLVLYLFGTPGQERFWFLWDGLVTGALGAVVLVDVRRLAESFDVLERLEKREVAFMVAVNRFPDAPVHPLPTLRAALDLPEAVPIVYCDARDRDSCRDVLLTLARYLLALITPLEPTTPPPAATGPSPAE
ncbi:MAG: ATP-binding protein [Catenulispora sp.]|nr:ATP-binding protein [Catenulispora sp.]